MTGAMIPEGADAVVMQEDVTVNEDGTVTFPHYLKLIRIFAVLVKM